MLLIIGIIIGIIIGALLGFIMAAIIGNGKVEDLEYIIYQTAKEKNVKHCINYFKENGFKGVKL